MIVRGDGALMSREMAVLHPVETTLSGPAASIAGARFLTGSDDAGDLNEQVFDLISDNLLKNIKGESRALRLTPGFSSQLIGVGAAAPWLLQCLAGYLGAELIIPENGGVANAVGALQYGHR